MIKIIAIGKKHESWIIDGLERYQKRLKQPFDVNWELIPHSSQTGLVARQNESKDILSKLSPTDYVILLDERGKLIDSPSLSKHIEQQFSASKNIVMIIGGAYGVDEQLINRANLVLSLSPMVFPHQLVRLILIEQIYRAQEIFLKHPYHHI